LLLENNVFRFFGDGINMDATDTNVPVTGVTTVRRNIVVDSWSPTGHSQGMHFTFNYGTSVFEENLFDHNGWNETLIVPASATFNIVASTVTWSSSIPLFNGTSITLHDNGDTLPTGLSFNTRYRVLNYSAGTFQLSTDGVNPITLSGTQSGTHLLAWDYPGASAQADTFNHGVYMDSDNDPVIFRGNIITNSSNVGIQIRPGGQIYENLNSLNPSAGFAAGSLSTVYNNVTIEGKGHTCNVPCPAQSDGLQIIASNGSTMTKNLTVNAFAGISAFSAMAVKNSQDDCGRVHFTIANPTLVTWTTQRVFTHGAVQFAPCGGTLPANISPSTTYYTSNNTVAGQAGPPTTANISLTDGGALISTAGNTQTDGFSPVFISINNVLTGNTIYNWGDATGNANIISLAGNTTSPNTNFNAGGGSFPDPTRSIGSYNAQIAGCASLPGGCTATTAAFLTSARAQRKGNWNNALMPRAVNNYIRAGFGL
jgi:hypothetical protein